MNLHSAGRALMAMLYSVALVACSTPMPVKTVHADFGSGGFRLDRTEVLSHLARPKNFDWSYRRANTATLDKMRLAMGSQTDPERKIQALSTITSIASSAAGGASGAISSAPAWDFFNNKAYWLTDTGWLICYDVVPATGARTFSYAAQVRNMGGTVQSFANTSITLSNDVKRIYLVSTGGTYLVLNAATGACMYSASVGVNAAFTQGTIPPTTGPAPFIDPLASFPDGRAETIYVIGNSGTATTNTVSLHRFTTTAYTSMAAPTFANPNVYTIPTTDTATITEGVRVPPIVLGGRAVIGTWKIDTGGNDSGSVIYYNTNCPTFTSSAVSGAANIRTVAVTAPVWGTPAIDTDDDLVPYFAFAATNATITMVDLASGSTGQTVPLLVDQATPPTQYTVGTGGNAITYTIDPPQSMDSYPYTGSTQSVVVYPDTVAAKSCSVTISETTTKALTASGGTVTGKNWLSENDFFSYSTVDLATDPTDVPAYAYARYTLSSNASTLAGESVPRGLLSTDIRMKCQVSSNGAGVNNVTPFNGWIVNSTLTDGATLWTPDNITPTNRPTFANGDTFGNGGNYAASVLTNGVHNGEKLRYSTANNPKANSFSTTGSGGPYDWECGGLISLGTTRTIAWYDDLDNAGSGETNNGVPHNAGAPHFENGASDADRPYLVLTLSSRGTSSRGMVAPLSVDSLNQQIWAVNTNAVYRISYQAFTSTGYTAASVPERMANLADPKKTFYAMTGLGSNVTYGPLYTASTAPTSRFVANFTAPLITNTNVYIQDNQLNGSGVPNRTTIRQFSFGTYPTASTNGTAPGVVATVDLTAAQAGAQGGGAFLAYDFESELLFASTYTPSTATGHLWILDRL